MLKFCSLYSSSSGNCTFLASDNTKVLIDAGVSCKNIIKELNEIDEVPEEIQAIFVTHEHSDHIKGVGIFSRKFDVPVYATEKTWIKMKKFIGDIPEENIKIIKKGELSCVGDLGVKAFSIPHDAEDPVGYSFFAGEKKITVATDIGHVSSEIMANLSGSIAALIESNHDVSLLRSGPYPYPLKVRILSDYGHLSNDNCAKLALDLVKKGTRKLILGHLSTENNRPDLAYAASCGLFEMSGIRVGYDVNICVAPKSCSCKEIFV